MTAGTIAILKQCINIAKLQYKQMKNKSKETVDWFLRQI